jgi:hypothetical protein
VGQFHRKNAVKSQSAIIFGGPERSRTSDLRFRKPLLYPEELSKGRSSELISNSTSADASKNTCFKRHLETVLPSESTELQRKRRSRERFWEASHVTRCRGRSQDAANSWRFLAAKSRLRAVRDEMVAEGEELQTNLLQVSQRGPASSSVLDEVFGTHRSKIFPTHVLRTTGTTPPVQRTPGVPPSPTGQHCINAARRHCGGEPRDRAA